MKQVTETQTINTKSKAMNDVIMYAFNFDYNFISKAFGENYISSHLENKFNDILHTTANKNLAMAFITFHLQLSDNNKEILNNYILSQNK